MSKSRMPENSNGVLVCSSGILYEDLTGTFLGSSSQRGKAIKNGNELEFCRRFAGRV